MESRNASMLGISSRHGAHQVAQKLHAATLPFQSRRRRGWPARSGKMVESRADALEKKADAVKDEAKAQAHEEKAAGEAKAEGAKAEGKAKADELKEAAKETREEKKNP